MLSFWAIQDTESFFRSSQGIPLNWSFFMAPLVAAAKDNRSGIVDFFVTEETAWTANVWIHPLLVRNVDRLMYKLSKFIVSLLHFAKPEMFIADYEWAEAYIKDGQFIGQLVVTPSFYLPGVQQDFDYFVRVRLTRPHRENAVPSLKQSHRAAEAKPRLRRTR
jgi:hypothetical protein